MKANFLHNKTKLIIQAALLVLIITLLVIGAFNKAHTTDFEAYCPFGGILSLGSKLWMGTMSCAMSENQLFMGIMLVIGVILFGKLFCGYLCPIGTVTEWLNKLFAKFNISIVLKGKVDRILRLGKYVLLFFTAYFTITSSELWCKKFDPYFVSVTGFGTDTVLWAGILTILVVIVGSVFIRFFWCKYVCPLSALSNIFTNILISAPIVIIYLIIRLIGWDLNIIWLILALCLSGAITEIFRYKFYSISLLRVTVNHDHCTSCGLCAKACPQGIDVYEYDKVTHPDCTLCMDCVKECDEDESIGLNQSKKTWIPPVILGGLIILGVILANNFSFKTLTERWGNYETLQNVKSIELKDMRSVKCYGSSKSLYLKLRRIPGIVGVDTWASDHRVYIFYNADKLSDIDVKKAVFTPSKYILQKFGDTPPDLLEIFEIPVNELWDVYDNYDLVRMLMKNPDIVGLKTDFGEPVLAEIYVAKGSVTPAELIDIIEQKSYTRIIKGEEVEVKVDFSCEGKGRKLGEINYPDFRKDFFAVYNQEFNNYQNYNLADLKVLEIDFPDAESTLARRELRYFTSHVSEYDGVVRLQTAFTDRPVLRIYFDPKQVSAEQVEAKLTSPKLKVFQSNGNIIERDNLLKFSGEPRVNSGRSDI
ncbi:MAG: 4Fe-4S binding protein [Candidatus Marinimicrobia bacterium]|nr:4Fe-4S binding protein [Candidatus Neomarinimicrobiota bacterium]